VKAFRDIPLRRKLTVVILLSATTRCCWAGTASVGYELVRFRHEIAAEAITAGNIIGDACAGALAFQDTNAAP